MTAFEIRNTGQANKSVQHLLSLGSFPILAWTDACLVRFWIKMDFGRNEGFFNQQHNLSETSPVRQVSGGLWPRSFYLAGFSVTRSLNDDLPQAAEVASPGTSRRQEFRCPWPGLAQ